MFLYGHIIAGENYLKKYTWRLKDSGDNSLERSTPSLTSSLMRDLYSRMLLTRIVDNCVRQLHQHVRNYIVPTCRGREAAQVGSAICIEVGTDFTLPYYRDLGVVLTIGMTPYEVLRTHVQFVQMAARQVGEKQPSIQQTKLSLNNMQPVPYWGYSKHNMVAGPVPVSTQILHAAGIAFACKLRKGTAVTVAYCGDGANAEPDFLEGITFAAQHQLPAVFVYEQDSASASLQALPLPAGLEYQAVDGEDVIAVYTAMQAAMQHAREGRGPVLLELSVHCQLSDRLLTDEESLKDPLYNCQRYMQQRNMWDGVWAAQLSTRLNEDVEQAMQDALQERAKNERGE
jgi:2-oxoisovalerate dehydrogenase E1 component alpha subunit